MTAKFTYTSTCKVHHLATEAATIQLSDSAWIERSDEFKGQPEVDASFCARYSFSGNFQLGLATFQNPLITSPMRIRTENSEELHENDPFRCHQCGHVAITLAIAFDAWFVVGLSSFWHSNNVETPSVGPVCTFFDGSHLRLPYRIEKCHEVSLRSTYDYVFRVFGKPWDNPEAKVLFFFLKCLAHVDTQRAVIVDFDLQHLFTSWDNKILSASLFFEHVFSEESQKVINGVRAWNETFEGVSTVDERLVDVVLNFRHKMAHSNASKAKKKLDVWKRDFNFDDEAARHYIDRNIARTAKAILRAVVLYPDRYSEFLSRRKML